MATTKAGWAASLVCILLAGCGGVYSGGSGGSSGGPRNTGGSYASEQDFFAKTIEPSMGYCRSCHVPGGVGDVVGGQNFMLSADPGQDLANMQASWDTLGQGDAATSPVLTYPAGQGVSHSGGAPWPAGSAIYNDVSILLQCFATTADQCMSLIDSGGTATPDELPLLDTNPVRAPMEQACQGKTDDTVLPTDPRSLVVPSLDTSSTAVNFNAWWVDVHNPPAPFLKNPLQRPTTCGEWNDQVAKGQAYLRQLAMAGTVITADGYNQLWSVWGLPSRPDDYDQEIIQRYGLAPAPYRNPYPLPGEDPATTDGGSGQLPLGLVQMHDAQGNYNGHISMNCSICHDSQFGSASDGPGLGTVWGKGNDNFDMAPMMADFAKAGGGGSSNPLSALYGYVPIPLVGATRGVTDPTTGLEVLMMVRDLDTLNVSLNVKLFPFHPAGGSLDGPSWWNLSHRPRKFVSGDLSSDEIRAMQTFLLTDFEDFSNGDEFKKQGINFEYLKSYLESLEPPPYPRPIDTSLAEAGAILFHTKDLWANGANADIPRPPGNGSCASCHGAYSPRFANQAGFLPTPALKGIGGDMVPLATIGTDPNRAGQVNGSPQEAAAVEAGWNTSWFGYDELNPDYAGSPQSQGGYTLAQFLDDYQIYQGDKDKRLIGPNYWQPVPLVYTAPVLYGIWASAPYFHNGSVPTVWGVLKPSDRPAVWQRQLTPPGDSGINRGFDRSLDAYDFDKMGWKVTEIPCDATGSKAAAACTPGLDPLNQLLAQLAATFGDQSWLTYLYIPPYNEQQVEARLVYNTYQYTQSNQGHQFTQVLTDDERRALIEYLKTL